MVERGVTGNGGWDAVMFAVDPGTGETWQKRFAEAGAPATSHTQYTLYSSDVDGNRFGVSSYPEPLFG